MIYNGKKVLTQETFGYHAENIGNYVEEAVVDDAINCLPSAYQSYTCVQMGEPCRIRKDAGTGRWRSTYHTFQRITSGPNSIWQYCGDCFQGETAMRGEDMPIVNLTGREPQ